MNEIKEKIIKTLRKDRTVSPIIELSDVVDKIIQLFIDELPEIETHKMTSMKSVPNSHSTHIIGIWRGEEIYKQKLLEKLTNTKDE